ncbi:hypothetical protein AGMMS49982_23570 [Bacteroidia bacterium]|nr:hypothetical protein AGMMS49982_23570 [Bacteroidia bacterium]
MMQPQKIWFESENIGLQLKDGRTAMLPLRDFPRLYNADSQQKKNYTLSPFGIHWAEIDEDLSFEGFFYDK